MRRFGVLLATVAAAIAIGLAALVLVPSPGSASAPSKSTRATGTITLLPSSSSGSWAWTAWCPFLPTTKGTTCAKRDPTLGHAQLDGNLWNLGGGLGTSGSLTTSVDAEGVLEESADFPTLPASPCTSSSCETWVRGYPEITYGNTSDQCPTSGKLAPQSTLLALPMRVAAIPTSLVGVTDFSATTPSAVTYDISYDTWLNATDTPNVCRGHGTVEVMVWLDYGGKKVGPPGGALETASIPYRVGGRSYTGTNAWSLYESTIDSTGRTGAEGGTVYVVLKPAFEPHPARDPKEVGGTVSVDLSSVYATVGKLLESRPFDWKGFATSHWLDTIPFGVEFGPLSGDDAYKPGDKAYFTMTVSKFCLSTGVSVESNVLPAIDCARTTPSASELYICTINYSPSTIGCHLREWPHFPVVITTANETHFWKLTWTRSATSASATGEFSFRVCTPNCAAGHSETYPVTLVASQAKSCAVKVFGEEGPSSSTTERASVYSSLEADWGAKGAPPGYTPVTLFEGHIPVCT